MSKRPRKRANRPGKQSSRPRRASGTRVLAEHLDGALAWDELLHAVEDSPGLAAEIVRAIQARRDAGTMAAGEAERLIEDVVEHEAFRVAEPGAVMKSLNTRIDAIEREHGLAEDEYWREDEGPPEWRMLNLAWAAYLDSTKIRILESLDEHALAAFIADGEPGDDVLGMPDDEVLAPFLPADDAGGAPTRVIAAVISRDDELLVCQRPAHKRHGGLWEFPGGKVEPDESDEQSARRELAEELGVRVVSAGASVFETRDPRSEFLIAFIPVRIEGNPECREHSALQWGTPEALASLPLAPSDRRFVELLIAKASELGDEGSS
jgi:mutator protein MutT